MKVFEIILIVIIVTTLLLICFSLAGANRAFSTPEQIAQDDEEQWRAIQQNKRK